MNVRDIDKWTDRAILALFVIFLFLSAIDWV